MENQPFLSFSTVPGGLAYSWTESRKIAKYTHWPESVPIEISCKLLVNIFRCGCAAYLRVPNDFEGGLSRSTFVLVPRVEQVFITFRLYSHDQTYKNVQYFRHRQQFTKSVTD